MKASATAQRILYFTITYPIFALGQNICIGYSVNQGQLYFIWSQAETMLLLDHIHEDHAILIASHI